MTVERQIDRGPAVHEKGAFKPGAYLDFTVTEVAQLQAVREANAHNPELSFHLQRTETGQAKIVAAQARVGTVQGCAGCSLRAAVYGPLCECCEEQRKANLHCTLAEVGTITRPGHYAAGAAHETWNYILAHGLGFMEGNIVKYVTRHRRKGGVDDLKKARAYLDKLIEQCESDAL